MKQKKLIEDDNTKIIEKIEADSLDFDYDSYINESDDNIIIDKKNDTESFFKELVTSMNDVKNISMKTEYINISENFNGAKLEFLAIYGNMPYLRNFITIFEKKRVSLQRKGRKEDVMILQKREEEIQKEKLQNLNNMFNIG